MKLRLVNFAERGIIGKERLILKATSEMDVGDYTVLLSNLTSDRSPIAGFRRAYWFPNQKVKAGDLIALYTKQGESSKKVLDDGRTAYFFYWGLKEPQWADASKGAVVMHSPEWKLLVPGEKELTK